HHVPQQAEDQQGEQHAGTDLVLAGPGARVVDVEVAQRHFAVAHWPTPSAVSAAVCGSAAGAGAGTSAGSACAGAAGAGSASGAGTGTAGSAFTGGTGSGTPSPSSSFG